MNVANLAADERPDPPTPINKALPPGCDMIRDTREICSIANRNITSGMGAVVSVENIKNAGLFFF